MIAKLTKKTVFRSSSTLRIRQTNMKSIVLFSTSSLTSLKICATLATLALLHLSNLTDLVPGTLSAIYYLIPRKYNAATVLCISNNVDLSETSIIERSAILYQIMTATADTL